MESNPKGFPLLPESPTSTGARLFSPHSHFKSSPSISCKAGAMLIPTGGQRGSMPLARPPPAHVEQYSSTNVFSYGNNHTLIEAKIKICTNATSTQQWGWPLCTMHNHSHRNIKTRINNTVNLWICRECLKVCSLRFEPPINERAVSLHTSCLSDHLSPSCHSNLTSQVFLRKGEKSASASKTPCVKEPDFSHLKMYMQNFI